MATVVQQQQTSSGAGSLGVVALSANAGQMMAKPVRRQQQQRGSMHKIGAKDKLIIMEAIRSRIGRGASISKRDMHQLVQMELVKLLRSRSVARREQADMEVTATTSSSLTVKEEEAVAAVVEPPVQEQPVAVKKRMEGNDSPPCTDPIRSGRRKSLMVVSTDDEEDEDGVTMSDNEDMARF